MLLCVKEFADVFSAFGTFIIGLIVAYIAYQQHKTNKDKLRLELYNKRFEIYTNLRELLKKYLSRKLVDNDLIEFNSKIVEADFLFDGDIVNYLNEIFTTVAYQIDFIPEYIDRSRVKKYEHLEGDSMWLVQQISNSKSKFSKYLKFSTSL